MPVETEYVGPIYSELIPTFGNASHQVAGGGGDSNHGQVEIFSLHRNVPRLVKTVSVNAAVLCLEYVKEPCVSSQEREAAKAQPSAKTGNIICVGLQDGRSHIPFPFTLDES